jgi:hypothetical protein
MDGEVAEKFGQPRTRLKPRWGFWTLYDRTMQALAVDAPTLQPQPELKPSMSSR